MSRTQRGSTKFSSNEFRRHHHFVRCLFAIAFLLVSSVSPNAEAAALPREARVPGGVAIVRVADATAPAPIVTRNGVRVWVTEHRVGKAAPGWYAVVGIPLGSAPGPQTLNVNEQGTDRTVSFKVAAKKYPVQKLTFTNKRMVEPNPDDVARIDRESKHLGEVKRAWRDAPDTSATFQLPAKGPLSSQFGLQRVLNGQPRSPHAGLDVAVPTGTPINSAAGGVVLDTGDYYFNGSTVWIDHGNGLLSLYCHLSEIKVRAGDRVAQGQLIGLSGMTGRATGPHLHWSVLLNTVMVEPTLFLPQGQ
jgi:murein DD-endopeptidase MepM/ murein hydrolase activator NlpD